MTRRFLPLALLGAVFLGGCHMPVQQNVDNLVCDRAHKPLDLPTSAAEMTPMGMIQPTGATQTSLSGDSPGNGGLQQASAQAQPMPKTVGKDLEKRLLEFNQGYPGANALPIVLPPYKDAEAISRTVGKYFPPLTPAGPEFQPEPGPNGQPYTLGDLQKMAVANSPLLRKAAEAIESAKGGAKFAAQYPNPSVGPSASQTPGPSGGPLFGAGFSQTILGFGKLRAAEAAALMDLENAKIAYRRAETDLLTSVRTSYFAVLVAQESIRANRALVDLTDEVYKIMVLQLKGGELATYEPLQMSVFALQARAGLITARNSYTLAWKQLAVSLGLPALPPTQLAGQIDMPIPLYRYDAILAHVLANHTDVKTAEVDIAKARYNLRLAELQPVPDTQLNVNLIGDNTPTQGTPLSWRLLSSGIQLGIPIPVWHQNQGGIWQAQGNLMQAVEEPHIVRNDLTARVADAYRRYDENKSLVELYAREALPKQVQAFRAAVKRHYGAEPDKVAYNDLISSEQNLVSLVGQYITVLGLQWQAVVDVASLVQTDDLFQRVEKFQVAAIPDLNELLKLPCCHPCSVDRDRVLKGAILQWPQAGLVPEADRQPATQPVPPVSGNEKQTSLPVTLEPQFTFIMPPAGREPALEAPAPQPLPLLTAPPATLNGPRQ